MAGLGVLGGRGQLAALAAGRVQLHGCSGAARQLQWVRRTGSSSSNRSTASTHTAALGSTPGSSSSSRGRSTAVCAVVERPGSGSSGLPIDRDAVSRPEDNPDFDDLELDEALYDELGITPEEREDQNDLSDAQMLDPEGFNLDFDEAGGVGEDTPYGLQMQLLDKSVYGPEAVVLAGFGPDEVAMTRVLLDQAGGQSIKVLPCTDETLHGSVDEAIWTREIDWEQPRPDSWNRSSSWGMQKAVLFSGMSVKAQATVLEPSRTAQHLRAVKDQRSSAANRRGPGPDDELKAFKSRMVGGGRRLGNLEELLGTKARDRLRAAQAAGPAVDEGEGRELTDAELDEVFEAFDTGAQDSDEPLGMEGLAGAQKEEGPESLRKARASAVTDQAAAGVGAPGPLLPAESRLLCEEARASTSGPSGDDDGTQARILEHVLSRQQRGKQPAGPRPPPQGVGGAAAASGTAPSDGDDDDLDAMAGFEDVLDSLLPPLDAPATGPGASAPAPAAAVGAPSSAAAGRLLARVQAAVREGADADALAALMDAYSRAQADARDEEDAAAQQEEQVRASKASASARPEAPPRRPGSSLPAGPSRPPSAKDDPFLNVKPEVRRALEGKQVRFVDLSKLPSKYREQYRVGQKNKQDQKLEEQREEQEQRAMLEALRQLEQDGGAGGKEQQQSQATTADDDFVVPPGWELPGQARQGGGLNQDDEGEIYEEPSMDADMVMQLVEAARASGLDPVRALAEALAMGVVVPPEAMAAAGVEMPSAELVAEILRDYAESADDEQEEGEEGGALDAGEEREGYPTAEFSPAADVRFGSGPGSSSWGEKWLSGRSDTLGNVAQAAAPSPPAARRWGDGLARAAARSRSQQGGAEPQQVEQRAPEGPAAARTLTTAELRDIAERKGLDLQDLLADARKKGVTIQDD
ncbi:hypothetical protein FOA52_007637 [Chlamydomonas sp. UWO 241]|nr:hypothetical protein FOA52_007637 [Chlamydomonas sp. UWO 241]